MQVEVTVAAGQGGTPADGARLREPHNSWELVEMAGDSDLLLTQAELFDADAWHASGVLTTGCWRGLARGTRTQGAHQSHLLTMMICYNLL